MYQPNNKSSSSSSNNNSSNNNNSSRSNNSNRINLHCRYSSNGPTMTSSRWLRFPSSQQQQQPEVVVELWLGRYLKAPFHLEPEESLWLFSCPPKVSSHGEASLQ